MTNDCKDIVVDTNIIRLYGNSPDVQLRDFFLWLDQFGCLTISQKLLREYIGTGNRLLASFIDNLTKNGRLIRIENSVLKRFNDDRHYKYTCNHEDILHARLVFLSSRKLLLSEDVKLVKAVNDFNKIDGIQPKASTEATVDFYS